MSEPDDLIRPCAHAQPQADSQLHGVCVFCWRDRASFLAARLFEVEAERDRYMFASDKQAVAWKERALKAEAALSLLSASKEK